MDKQEYELIHDYIDLELTKNRGCNFVAKTTNQIVRLQRNKIYNQKIENSFSEIKQELKYCSEYKKVKGFDKSLSDEEALNKTISNLKYQLPNAIPHFEAEKKKSTIRKIANKFKKEFELSRPLGEKYLDFRVPVSELDSWWWFIKLKNDSNYKIAMEQLIKEGYNCEFLVFRDWYWDNWRLSLFPTLECHCYEYIRIWY